MNIEIITPDTVLYQGEAKAVVFPGIDGSFEILNSHAALISALKTGSIKLTDNSDKVENFAINGGVVEVLNNKVLVLAEA